MSLLFGEYYARCAPSCKAKVVYVNENESHFSTKTGILKKLRGDYHLSDKAAIFFNAISHGKCGSSLYVEISCSSFFRSLYPNAASLSVSALFSGHSKCFRTALSSTCNTVEVYGLAKEKKGWFERCMVMERDLQGNTAHHQAISRMQRRLQCSGRPHCSPLVWGSSRIRLESPHPPWSAQEKDGWDLSTQIGLQRI